ncbi:MAG: type II toxin-antitoxin system VapC family toxin [Jatrophihabitans sp.]|nr:MAG: type II toxin-antitoxin system VapC family toxin [Jatrophihabitans sp.]
MSARLIDTHVWLWLQADPARVGADLRKELETASRLLLSVASSWEIAIKYRLGKLPLPSPPDSYLPKRIRTSGTEVLPIELDHCLRAGSLPPHHHDAFDRLLIAQAQALRIPIVTADPVFDAYDVRTVRV